MVHHLNFFTTGRPAKLGEPGPAEPLLEHAVVELSTTMVMPDGRTLPSGAQGAVVFVHEGGRAYEVEFVEPFHTVETVPAAHLSRAPAA